MNFALPDLLYSLVILQFLVAGGYLLIHPGNRRLSNRLLSVFFLSLSLNLLDNLLVIKKAWLFNPYFVSWGICLPLLFGPLLYLFTRSVLIRPFYLSWRKGLHFLPFVLAFVVTGLFYLSRSKENLLPLLNNMAERRIPLIFYWTSGFIFLQFFIYLGASIRMIRQFKRAVEENYSDPSRADVRWLYTTILFFSFCMFLAACNGMLGLTKWSKYYYFIYSVIVGLLLVFIYRILVATLSKPGIFGLPAELAAGAPASGASRQLPALSTSSPAGPEQEEQQRILANLIREMKSNKPYLDPDLSLEQLARRLSLRPKVLSRVINLHLHQHFFDFVNTWRIEEAKRILSNPPDKKITVLEVLYECGFNSKSSFNTLFKRYTGQTPTVFRRTHFNRSSAL